MLYDYYAYIFLVDSIVDDGNIDAFQADRKRKISSTPAMPVMLGFQLRQLSLSRIQREKVRAFARKRARSLLLCVHVSVCECAHACNRACVCVHAYERA